MNMNIGVFSYYYLPLVNGVVLTIRDWKIYTQSKHITSRVYVPGGSDKTKDTDVSYFPAVPLYKRFGITVPMFPEGMIEKEIRLHKHTLLHVHHPHYIGQLALFAKKKLGVPLVFTYHTRYADYLRVYLPYLSISVSHYILTRGIVRFMNQCDGVTVANDSLRDEIIRYGVRSPVYVVPPGVDTRFMASGNRTATRKRFHFRSSDEVLLYVGRFAKEKNIYFLIRAFARIAKKNAHARFLLCGHGLEEDQLRRVAKQKHIDHRIHFATSETPETMRHMYAAADIFIFASKTETYGRAIVEAMAAGLPIVALRAVSVIDLLKDGISGRIVTRDSSVLFCDVVLSLLRNKDVARQLGEAAAREAREKYDNVVSGRLLLSVYKAVDSLYRQKNS